MRHFRVFRILCTSLCLASTPVLAQYTLKKIVFEGATPYSQTALEAASGLKPGDQLTNDTMQQAAQRLSDTGAFGDLQVTLDGPAKAISIIFKITPLDKSHELTASFDNFIWFTPEELDKGVRGRVPLFAATIPESGNLQDAVESALADMLKEKGITATLTHDVYEPSAFRPLRIVAYRIKSPAITIRSVNLTGGSPELAASVHEIQTRIAGKPFNDGLEKPTTVETILQPYLKAGYLNAHLSDRVLTPITSSSRIEVDLTGSINAGVPFHVGNIVWAGSPQISSSAFAATTPLHTGDLVTPAVLAKAIDLIAAAYRKQGYADVVVSATPSIDSSTSQVSYTFTAAPGDIYRIRSLTPVNLTSSQQGDFNRGWTLKAGDVFDSEYITNFLKMNSALRSFDGYSATYKALRDPESHLVDVTVTFSRGSSVTVTKLITPTQSSPVASK
jgi:outer membrane protein assembly factor BamA